MLRAFASTLCAFVLVLPEAFAISILKHSSSEASYSFGDFVKEFNRSYVPGTREWISREAIFRKRMKKVLDHQANPDAKWQAAIGKFGDFTDAEFNAMMGYKKQAHSKKHGHLLQRQSDDPKWTPPPPGMIRFTYEQQDIPDTLDRRRNLTHIGFLENNRDQGHCGSCWAVGVANLMDYYMAEKAHKSVTHRNLLHAEAFPSLSAQSVLSCTENTRNCGGTGGCHGATMQLGFSRIMETGLPLEKDYKYTAGQYHEEAAPCEAKKAKSKVWIAGYYQLPSNKKEPLMHALVQHGPVGVSAAARHWAHYHGGIFDGYHGNDQDFVVNHAVVLYGYSKPKGLIDGWWTIKNSWGPNWGEKGFIRIIMYEDDETHCGMDYETHKGVACEGDPEEDLVCGSFGILYDAAFPANVTTVL